MRSLKTVPVYRERGALLRPTFQPAAANRALEEMARIIEKAALASGQGSVRISFRNTRYPGSYHSKTAYPLSGARDGVANSPGQRSGREVMRKAIWLQRGDTRR